VEIRQKGVEGSSLPTPTGRSVAVGRHTGAGIGGVGGGNPKQGADQLRLPGILAPALWAEEPIRY